MAEIAPLVGILVGFERRPYAEFTNRQTGEIVRAGETLWVYVGPEDGQGAPRPVKCKAESDFLALQDAGFGCRVEIRVELDARNNQITRALASIDHIGDRPPVAA